MEDDADDLQWLGELSTEGNVCASRARSEYRIPESVLRPLECRKTRNPMYASAAPMRLYSREAVLAAAVSHHSKKRAAEEARASKPKKPKYTPKPRVAPDLPTLYDKLRWADPDSVFLESNVLSTVVEQLVASYSKDGHSPLAAVTWAARDLALLSQSSKAMHATAMDAWPDLDRVMADLIPPTEQCLLTLPEVEGISWDEVTANTEGLRVVDLQKACRALSLKVSGTKADLIAQLRTRFRLARSVPVPARLLYFLASARPRVQREEQHRRFLETQPAGWGDHVQRHQARWQAQRATTLCTGCQHNPLAQACPHRMCGNCCQGCPRHTRH